MIIRESVYQKFLKSLTRLVEEQIRCGMPRWKIVRSFRGKSTGHMECEKMLAYSEIVRSLENLIIDRNIEGQRLEKDGCIEEAIKLYEANVKDCFDGSHPYERLRIIYSAQGRYDQAVRVCEAYIKNGSSSQDIRKYNDYIADLNRKLADLNEKP